MFEFLEGALPKTTDIVIYPNIELFDASKAAYVECDAIVLTRSFVAVVELKDWFGAVTVQEPKWRRGNSIIDSPHVVNNRKCKVFKSYIQHALRGVAEPKLPFVQSVVVLTNADARVEGASSARHANIHDRLITLDGMEELADYLKRRMYPDEKSENVLSDYHFRRLADQLNKDKQSATVSYEDQIPGYRIREDRGSAAHYISYIAERNPNIDHRLYRLRVFGKLSNDPAISETQLRSLRAAAALPYHPGIRSVSAHANGRNLIVEVSDWTDTRSLDDLFAEHNQLDWRRAALIVNDIALALDFIHQSAASLVHRNVQPKSILIGIDGRAQLTDFDLTFDPGAALTVLGTNYEEHLSLAFTAPEVLLGKADFTSDVYSLGVVFFRALVGKVPSNEISINDELASALQATSCEEPKQAALCTLIGSMLAQQPFERPTASKVAADISGLLGAASETEAAAVTEMTDTPAYTDIQLIAEGATAQVFRVDNHGELFIHKVFKPHVARDEALHERDILREVDQLDLPLLFPRVRHFSEVAGHRWCLATDLVPGQSLRAAIAAGKRPDIAHFLNVSRVMLSALARLHSGRGPDFPGIIHNDLTPNNILVDASSNAVGLIDFGCASAPGVISLRGTPGYVHPALISRGDMNACPQNDLYALAKTLIQWLLASENVDREKIAPNDADDLQHTRILAWLEEAIAGDGCIFASAEAMYAALESTLKLPTDPSPALEIKHNQGPLESVNIASTTIDEQVTNGSQVAEMRHTNSFVDYLNTLHNVSAGNANALAEYQSTNRYFASIYEPTQIARDIHKRLTGGQEVVVVLSGHAGDGKSTVALEVLKQLRNIAPEETLPEPPNPQEVALVNGAQISILKDMSEHTAVERLKKFELALKSGSGSWLIVSNTGPLLNTLSEMRGDIEEKVLGLLDQPIDTKLDDQTHCIRDFDKPILIANLSKLDNVETAVHVLSKISSHPSWSACDECAVHTQCPIRRNINAIQQASQLKERVSSVYRLLTAYERRLTIRQMTAHLAYSITGGHGCTEVAGIITQVGADAALRKNLFSELFFGFSDRKRGLHSSSLYCVEQLQAHIASERTRPAVEVKLQREALTSFAPIPNALEPVLQYWQAKSMDGVQGGMARGAVRRLVFLFGTRLDPIWWSNFIEDFTGSPTLQDWQNWRQQGLTQLSSAERRALVRQILSVLSEHCIGAVRTSSLKDKLYITLRRDDLETTQPVQVVIGEYDENDFRLDFSPTEKMPSLYYSPADREVFMRLPLPLLDFVNRRSTGDFGQELDPIHVNQLDLFCSKLIGRKRLPEDDLRLLSIGVTGEQNVYRVAIDNSNMEIY
ncbi:protein kinase domain-containing protein [Paraburkholderia atlantica]|uniref:protein kinase domain-containing protein n=1 Tax=Paraburkholderia atlantica TaxID=2654982 RepID=UPI00160B1FF6|nr:serine/threonine protein kinase [Paraburkholderia atlantica]